MYIFANPIAQMLESVDKHVSGACAFTGMRVRVPLCAHTPMCWNW